MEEEYSLDADLNSDVETTGAAFSIGLGKFIPVRDNWYLTPQVSYSTGSVDTDDLEALKSRHWHEHRLRRSLLIEAQKLNLKGGFGPLFLCLILKHSLQDVESETLERHHQR